MQRILTAFVCLVYAILLTAEIWFNWSGYDYESGTHVEIERDNLVRRGREIEFYDYGAGEYRYGDVESVRRIGPRVEIEIYDHEAGEHRYFEMDQ